MVDILCPHCEEEIGLDDDASGEFSCPFCEGEFEWNMEPETDDDGGGSARDLGSQKSGGIPPTSPIEWFGHGFSIFILIFVIICLGSGSLYSISATVSLEGTVVDIMDLNYGRNDYSGEGFAGERGVTYDNRIAQLKEEAAINCEFFPDECGIWNVEEIEAQESWNRAGNYLGFFAFIALFSSIALVVFRLILMLDKMKTVILNERMYISSIYGKMILPFFTSGCLFIGMILFMILSPGAALYEGPLNEVFPTAELSSGFGMIVWFSLLLSIGYSVFSVFEMNVE